MAQTHDDNRLPSGGSEPLTMQEQNDILTNMTPEQVERGLFPRTFEDLKYRASAFSRVNPDKVQFKKKK